MSEKKLFDIGDDDQEIEKSKEESPKKTPAPKKTETKKQPAKKSPCIVQRRSVIITPEFKEKIERIRKNKGR